MPHATLRMYAELNGYLGRDRRQRDILLALEGPCPARHLVERCRVPHTEVELLLRNGRPVDLEEPVAPGDRLAVYPPFLRLASKGPGFRPRRPPGPARFFADAQLGRLARHLRLLGFDTLYERDIGDAALVRRAADEARIVLSRDRDLLIRRGVEYGCHLRVDDPCEQLDRVLARYVLAQEAKPFTRCMECNGELHEVPKSEVTAELEAHTWQCFDAFWRCAGCGRVYWRGSHYERLRARVEKILAGVPSAGAGALSARSTQK
jgi:uncharacterized protein with PIN domain